MQLSSGGMYGFFTSKSIDLNYKIDVRGKFLGDILFI